ncbi:hypothetical protein [Clostridium sp.]|uniref:hypothetical protein n=1 Tax=Clostridium sp. TaxID=1506 RepID=UPI00262B2A42|nr:hypothetical protein [Clostridium sp.]
MADFTVDFDTPKPSSVRSVQVLGTVPGNNTQGYVRIKVTVTNPSRSDIYYQTISIAPTSTQYVFHGTYNVAIVPKFTSGTVTPSYAFSFTAQA